MPKKFEGAFGYGDVYTWVALCSDCKLVPCFFVGRRGPASAEYFIRNLSRKIRHKVQITTDGHKTYVDPIINHFGERADFAQVVKIYGHEREDANVRYSPPDYVRMRKHVVIGNPDYSKVSTSHVERQNLTMRMGMRRFTRLTNGFSKKVDNLQAAVALHFMHYNFCRIHQTTRMTPAMKAGKASRVFEIADIVGLLDGTTPAGTSPNPLILETAKFKRPHRRKAGKNVGAHRWAWERLIGPIPKEKFVLHKCDVKACVNIDHLYLGNRKDNAKDARERGQMASGMRHGTKTHPERIVRGQRKPNAHYSMIQVAEMRALYKPRKWTLSALAKRFGGTISSVSRAIRGDTYALIAGLSKIH